MVQCRLLVKSKQRELSECQSTFILFLLKTQQLNAQFLLQKGTSLQVLYFLNKCPLKFFFQLDNSYLLFSINLSPTEDLTLTGLHTPVAMIAVYISDCKS